MFCREPTLSITVDHQFAHHIARTTDEDWRRVTEGLTRRFSGEFPYPRTGTVLTWRTERERAAISILALEPRIDNIEVIPERVTIIVDGKRREWSPALRLTSGRRVAMVDVIRDSSLESPARDELTAQLTQIYAERGISYTVMLESRVRKQPRLSNARFVLGYRSVDPDPDTELAVVGALTRGMDASLGYLESKLAWTGDVRAAVFAMAARGQVKLDLWARDLADMSVKLVSWEGLR
jgi:hypothetical protein